MRFIVAILLLFLVTRDLEASDARSLCRGLVSLIPGVSLFARSSGKSNDRSVRDRVEVLFFAVNMQIHLDQQMVNFTRGVYVTKPYALNHLLDTNPELPIARVPLFLTEEEFEKLATYIEHTSNSPTGFSCTSGACWALAQSGVLQIPFPFADVPSLTLGYLTSLNMLGSKKVGKVKLAGAHSWLQVERLIMASPILPLIALPSFGVKAWSEGHQTLVTASIGLFSFEVFIVAFFRLVSTVHAIRLYLSRKPAHNQE